ncbi:MAG TPA: histidine phosphatase family protein [Beijerinckiaceae bacterium]|nr:histidine phosphatase family protein [Beijerinckiaceae bacterium]
MKTLIVLRHAKAVPAGPSGDYQRVLADAGRHAATLIGADFKKHGLKPEVLLVSSAARTQETFRIAAAEAGLGEASIEDDLYLAAAGVLLRRLRKVPPRTKSVLLVGHNPGVAELVQKLADPSESDAAALSKARARFPTAACAVLEVLTPWSELQDGDCALKRYVTPADLGGANEE